MKIAVIGPLGLPARYGGITRHCEEITTRLAADGHEVTVFGRSGHVEHDTVYRGVRVRRVPVLPVQGWETFGYGLAASIFAAVGRFDVVHYHGIAAVGFCFLPRLAGKRLAFTVHSLDFTHEKWGRPSRAFLRLSTWVASRLSSVMIAVSGSLAAELRERYPGREIVHVSNGLVPPEPTEPSAVRALGLEPGGYLLFVGRLAPEKGVDVLVEAHGRVPGAPPLVLVGAVRHEDAYAARVRRALGSGVRLLEAQPREAVQALYAQARLCVAPSRHEGFNLTVLEAMSHGRCVVASDIPAHRELLTSDGLYFRSGDAEDLARVLSEALADPSGCDRRGRSGRDRARSARYDWDRIAAETGKLLARA